MTFYSGENRHFLVGVDTYDPIALDQACIDLIALLREGAPLLSHINGCNGLDALTYGEEIGLGNRTYALMTLDN